MKTIDWVLIGAAGLAGAYFLSKRQGSLFDFAITPSLNVGAPIFTLPTVNVGLPSVNIGTPSLQVGGFDLSPSGLIKSLFGWW